MTAFSVWLLTFTCYSFQCVAAHVYMLQLSVCGCSRSHATAFSVHVTAHISFQCVAAHIHRLRLSVCGCSHSQATAFSVWLLTFTCYGFQCVAAHVHRPLFAGSASDHIQAELLLVHIRVIDYYAMQTCHVHDGKFTYTAYSRLKRISSMQPTCCLSAIGLPAIL
jgi:hypothetical protein